MLLKDQDSLSCFLTAWWHVRFAETWISAISVEEHTIRNIPSPLKWRILISTNNSCYSAQCAMYVTRNLDSAGSNNNVEACSRNCQFDHFNFPSVRSNSLQPQCVWSFLARICRVNLKVLIICYCSWDNIEALIPPKGAFEKRRLWVADDQKQTTQQLLFVTSSSTSMYQKTLPVEGRRVHTAVNKTASPTYDTTSP